MTMFPSRNIKMNTTEEVYEKTESKHSWCVFLFLFIIIFINYFFSPLSEL